MEILFLNILLVGAGIIIWLLIRALPRVSEEGDGTRGWFDRWLTSKLPGKIDAFTSTLWVRTLRRFKVFVLRLENGINQKLQTMKLESGEGIKGDKIDLKKVVEERAAEVEAENAIDKEN
jgi:hypothetical protein